MRFVLVGFDGANPELIERYLSELPNFRRLIEQGAWGPLSPMAPADTPTNWCCLATGATPATHGITGFEIFRPGTSLTESMGIGEAYRTVRGAEFLWEAADRLGKKSLLVNYPFAWYSREGLDNTVIVGGDGIKGGLCEIRGAAFYCTPDIEGVQDNEPLELRRDGDGYVGELRFGPAFKTVWTDVGQETTDEVEDEGPGVWARLRTVPGSPATLVIAKPDGAEVARLQPGAWSDPVRLRFGDEPGWVRFFVPRLSDDGASLHLLHAMITRETGWTKPADLAARLMQIGPYQQGLEADGGYDREGGLGAWPTNMRADVDLLRHSGDCLVAYCEALAADNPDWEHLYLQFHSTDGFNHRRLINMIPGHYPTATPEVAAQTEEWLIENLRETDVILGRMADFAEVNGAVLAVVSDHSAVPCHTWIDDMRPFIERGWLVFDDDGNWHPSSRIRASRNRSIYVNLKGRQPDGVVEPEDFETVRDEVIATLLALRDPRTGACPVALAARREDLRPLGIDGPSYGDIVWFMRPGFSNSPCSGECRPSAVRVNYGLLEGQAALEQGSGWHRSLLGTHIDAHPDAMYEDFCTNRAILLLHGPGIRKGVRIPNARTIDVAPTLALLAGMPAPAQCEGAALTSLLD